MSEDVENTPPEPEYEAFDTQQGFDAAVERLLDQPGRELRIFDPDLLALRLESEARVERLRAFLRASRTRRLFVVVHDTDHLTKRCARMMSLLATYSHAIQIYQTPEDLKSLQDSFLVLDADHYVRRAVARFFRGAMGLNDPGEGLAMRGRFIEIWTASHPAVSATTLGL